jgi:hypothetical protein
MQAESQDEPVNPETCVAGATDSGVAIRNTVFGLTFGALQITQTLWGSSAISRGCPRTAGLHGVNFHIPSDPLRIAPRRAPPHACRSIRATARNVISRTTPACCPVHTRAGEAARAAAGGAVSFDSVPTALRQSRRKTCPGFGARVGERRAVGRRLRRCGRPQGPPLREDASCTYPTTCQKVGIVLTAVLSTMVGPFISHSTMVPASSRHRMSSRRSPV